MSKQSNIGYKIGVIMSIFFLSLIILLKIPLYGYTDEPLGPFRVLLASSRGTLAELNLPNFIPLIMGVIIFSIFFSQYLLNRKRED
jgi:hypothetical protein